MKKRNSKKKNLLIVPPGEKWFQEWSRWCDENRYGEKSEERRRAAGAYPVEFMNDQGIGVRITGIQNRQRDSKISRLHGIVNSL
jgi:hypothetical protein